MIAGDGQADSGKLEGHAAIGEVLVGEGTMRGHNYEAREIGEYAHSLTRSTRDD